jgi:hypothetical protein
MKYIYIASGSDGHKHAQLELGLLQLIWSQINIPTYLPNIYKSATARNFEVMAKKHNSDTICT